MNFGCKRAGPFLKTAVAWCFVLAATPAPACFTVLSDDDHVIYAAADAPVDMSRPIHETLPAIAPGAHLIFDLDTRCATVPDKLRVIHRGPSLVRVLSRPDGAVVSSLSSELAQVAGH